MKSLFSRWRKTSSLVVVALALVVFSSDCASAAILTSGDLLTVTDRQLRSYSFTGTLKETLAIRFDLLPGNMAFGTAGGLSVMNDRIFVALISPIGAFSPRIVEVDPLTGHVIGTLFTFTHGITALGDDGTNLIVLDSVNLPLKTYTYNINGTLVSTVTPVKPANLNYQAEGIAGDGQSVFMAVNFSNPLPQPPNGNVLLTPIVTNTTSGALVGYFNTGIPGTAGLGGLAYNPNDQTLWVASKTIYQHYTQQGTLLSSFLGDGSSPTGLAIIAPAAVAAVPEPASLALWSLGAFGCAIGAYRRKRRLRF